MIIPDRIISNKDRNNPLADEWRRASPPAYGVTIVFQTNKCLQLGEMPYDK